MTTEPELDGPMERLVYLEEIMGEWDEDNAREVIKMARTLQAENERLVAALRPFAAVRCSSLYPRNGSDGDGYRVYLAHAGDQWPTDFTGLDISRAMQIVERHDRAAQALTTGEVK